MHNPTRNKTPSKIITALVVACVFIATFAINTFAVYVSDSDALLGIQNAIVPYFKSRAFYGTSSATNVGDFITFGDDSATGEQAWNVITDETITVNHHTFTDLTHTYSTLSKMQIELGSGASGGYFDSFDLILNDAYIGDRNKIFGEGEVFGYVVVTTTTPDDLPNEIPVDYLVYDIVNDVQSENLTSINTVKRSGTTYLEKRIGSTINGVTYCSYPIYEALYDIQYNVSNDTITTYVDYLYLSAITFYRFDTIMYECYGYYNEDAEDVDTPLQSYNPISLLRGIPNITDNDISAIGSWLGSAVDGFFSFEIGGLNLGYIFVAIFAILILVAILKFFAGG